MRSETNEEKKSNVLPKIFLENCDQYQHPMFETSVTFGLQRPLLKQNKHMNKTKGGTDSREKRMWNPVLTAQYQYFPKVKDWLVLPILGT